MALEGGEWSAARPGRTLPRERPGTHFTGGWVGPRASRDGRKISSPPEFDLGPSSLKLSRYTDWAATGPTLKFGSFEMTSIILGKYVIPRPGLSCNISSSYAFPALSTSFSALLVKGKSVPLQSWTGPEGSRKLRFPDLVKKAQDGGKVVSLMHRPPLPPRNTPGTHFC